MSVEEGIIGNITYIIGFIFLSTKKSLKGGNNLGN